MKLPTQIDAGKIEKDLDEGWGLPVLLYSDDSWFNLEMNNIFGNSWFYVGTTHQVSKPGDTLLGHAGNIPVVVTRDHAGDLHALINVCRHRGFPVCRKASNLRTLSCGYHGWTYNLDGSLRGAPGSGDEEFFNKEDFGLRKLPVKIWGQIIFVASSPDVLPFEEHFPAFATTAKLRNFDLEESNYTFVERYESTANANWKLWYDNTLECFHCPLVHSASFNDAYGVKQGDYETIIEERVISYFFPPRPHEKTDSLKMTFNRHLHLFPGFFVYQQDDIMLIHQMRPLSTEKTHVFWDIFAEKGADPERVAGWSKIWVDTLSEDKHAVEAVQNNISTDTFTANRYMRSREPVPLHINNWIWAACSAKKTEV